MKVIMRIITVSFFLLVFTLINTSIAYANNAAVPVLVYHHILPDASNTAFRDNAWTISAENFEHQMRYLHENEFHTITLNELEAFLFDGQPLPPKSIMIHFDDGYYSNFVYAYPILQRYNLNATAFLITREIEILGYFQMPMDHNRLIWASANTIYKAKDVFESASHSHNMHDLAPCGVATLLSKANHQAIVEDTLRSFDFVSNHRAYAFPLGQYNPLAIAALEEAGITMAFTIRRGYITRHSNPMELPRFTIYRETTFDLFKQIVNGGRDG